MAVWCRSGGGGVCGVDWAEGRGGLHVDAVEDVVLGAAVEEDRVAALQVLALWPQGASSMGAAAGKAAKDEIGG